MHSKFINFHQNIIFYRYFVSDVLKSLNFYHFFNFVQLFCKTTKIIKKTLFLVNKSIVLKTLWKPYFKTGTWGFYFFKLSLWGVSVIITTILIKMVIYIILKRDRKTLPST